MRSIRVNLKKRSYEVVIGENIIPSLGIRLKKMGIGDHAYMITNSKLKRRYADKVIAILKKSGFSVKVKTIPDTERSKSIAVLSAVINDLAKSDLRKRTFILSLGGGVVGDLSGFVASIYKRGIPYIQVPTTLLAQVDSAIGGKTAVDLEEGKNLVGAFYQPSLVFSDVALLKSLDIRQVRTGLAEIIKYGVIKDAAFFSYLENNLKSILKLNPKILEFIVARSSKIKAEIVSIDEREEKGIRTILNFGHTIGHAIEAATGYRRYTHGEAVSLGMLVALDISEELGFISKSLLKRVESLIESAGLPLVIKSVSLKSILSASQRDKKFIGAKNKFVLVTGLGKTKIVENLSLRIVKQAIKRRLG